MDPTEPVDVGPTQPAPAPAYQIHTETAKVKGLLTGEGIRYLFTSFVEQLHATSGVVDDHPRGHDRRRAGRGRRADRGADPKTGRGLPAELADLHHRPARHHLQHRLGRRLPGADPAWARSAFQSVGRHPLAGIAAAFAGVGAGFGVNVLITPLDGVLTEITNDAVRLVEPAPHRPRREPLLRHRLDDLRRDRPHLRLREVRREPARRLQPCRRRQGRGDSTRARRSRSHPRTRRADCARRSSRLLAVVRC